MGSFIKSYCRQIGKSKLGKADLESPAYKVVRSFHSNSISLQFHMEECHLLLTDQIDLVNLEGNQIVPDVSKSLPLGVRSHMRILSVVSLQTYDRYGYTFLKEIVLRRADYKEHKILEADFKNLHPNDFEDMYLLHLQGKLNHLSSADKVLLFNAINMWIRNIVIRNQDYTIFSRPRAVIYRYRNDQKKMMWETEVHNFSDGTLIRILEKLDHMVKDFRLFKYNPGMENRIWSEDDKMRSKEFMEVIERRLKIRRIFRSLECFVRIMQKSQENGQNWTNTDTGTDRVFKSRGFDSKKDQMVNSSQSMFWSTAMVKTINGEAKIHALVDGKKIIITESSFRRDLQLADE
ncbi:hypothetical protein Tco_0941723 [Tanacetum coccineum]|uniref:Uncharacterized protein n=1 Tax=Tanacetum coccineum TaxID=301880 RepID=A0ABQ5DSL3_9ASTR